MTMEMPTSLVFQVERGEPELISPAKPTPYEIKNVSNIDDQYMHRIQIPCFFFYRNSVGMEGRDPVKVIKEAISKALVYYYPFAGRLRDAPNDKLMVECTGEGIMFIEANANVRLQQFGEAIYPPFPCIEDLLYDGPGSGDILHGPLLLVQVTRLLCGGFTLGVHLNHVMSDGTGLLQFLTAVGEIARGACVPSVPPVWRRELLNARNPPQVSCAHYMLNEFNRIEGPPLDEMVQIQRSFFFGCQDIATLRNHLPPHLRTCTRFEILTACLWRCRTIALSPIPGDQIGFGCIVNARTKFNPPLPVGYYGNAFGQSAILSTASKLCQNPLGYAVELVIKMKEYVTDEFMRSSLDLLVKKPIPYFSATHVHGVSDVTNMGFKNVDFGWGKPIHGGPTESNLFVSFLVSTTNNKGEDGILMEVTLSRSAMEKFTIEIDKLIREPQNLTNSSFILSSM